MTLFLAFLAGVAASFINSFAGGGSLISLPCLLFLGLPAAVANGTNKIGLLAGAMSASANHIRKRTIEPRFLVFSIPFGIVGAVVGSFFSIGLSEQVYRILISASMVGVLVILLVKPQRFLQRASRLPAGLEKILSGFLFLAIGFYGGFIQVGMGYLVIIVLSLFSNHSLVKMGAFKMMYAVFVCFFSVIIFIAEGKVDWPVAISLVLGNAAGGWLGTQLAIDKGDRFIRPVLAVVVSGMAVKVSGLWEWVVQNYSSI